MDAVVDQPACTLWSVLLTQFPEAKVPDWLQAKAANPTGDPDGEGLCRGLGQVLPGHAGLLQGKDSPLVNSSCALSN